jgi:hypothetical protein
VTEQFRDSEVRDYSSDESSVGWVADAPAWHEPVRPWGLTPPLGLPEGSSGLPEQGILDGAKPPPLVWATIAQELREEGLIQD